MGNRIIYFASQVPYPVSYFVPGPLQVDVSIRNTGLSFLNAVDLSIEACAKIFPLFELVLDGHLI